MVQTRQTTASLSEEDFDTLDRFAEQTLQAGEMSELMAAEPPLVQRGAIYLIAMALGFSLCLLYFGKIPVWVSAKGKIIPKGEPVPVYPLENGSAQQVLARVGDRLLKNDPLIVIDRSQSNLDLASLLRERELQEKQIQAMLSDISVIKRILASPPAFLAQVQPVQLNDDGLLQQTYELKSAGLEMAKAESINQQRFQAQKQQILQEIELARQKILLLSDETQKDSLNLAQEEKLLVRKQKRLADSRQLAQNGYLSEIELEGEEERYRSAELSLERNQRQLEQKKLNLANEKLRLSELEIKLQSEKTETSEEYRQAVTNYRQTLNNLRQSLDNQQTELKKLKSESENTKGRLRLAENKIPYATIAMPVTGTVGKIKIKYPGEYVSAGIAVAHVLPQGTPLVVNASVPNKDIGFLKKGLEAQIKVEAYPFQQFGTIPARVQQVFPNIGDQDNFTITLELLQDTLNSGKQEIYLFPGLTVQAEVKTGKKSLFELLFSPQQGKK